MTLINLLFFFSLTTIFSFWFLVVDKKIGKLKIRIENLEQKETEEK